MSNIGDIKTKNKFALLPVKIKGKYHWLVRYACVYVYMEFTDVDDMNTFYYGDWAETDRFLCVTQ